MGTKGGWKGLGTTGIKWEGTLEADKFVGDGSGLTHIGGTFTAGSVLFADTDGSITQDNANLFWDNTNNRLGIGTTSPGRKLEVQAGTATEDPIAIRSSDGNSYPFYISLSADDGKLFLRNNANLDIVSLSANGDSYLNGGNVGFGTASPGVPLDVQSNTGTNAVKIRGRSNAGVDEGTLTFTKNDGTTTQGYIQTDTTNLGIYAITDLKLGGGNSVDMTIKSDGKVGIGTDAPASLLSLSGSGVLLNIDVTNSNNYKMNFRDAGIITGYLGSNLSRPFVVTNSAISGENFSVMSGGIVGMMNYNANPTIPLSVLSGGIFISGGALFYKGDQGTITQLAGR